MPDFAAFFSNQTNMTDRVSVFTRLSECHRDRLGAETRHIEHTPNTSVIVTDSNMKSTPTFFIKPDKSGWIVVKGVIFDIEDKEKKPARLEDILELFLSGNSNTLNRYEGAFALAAWDEGRKQGWVVNDQASILNLYFGEYQGGLYVTTNALTLARILKIPLDPSAVQEFLALNVVLSPSSLFLGLKRVNVGEHVLYTAGRVQYRQHWRPYKEIVNFKASREAAEAIDEVIVDRLARLCGDSDSILCDLTGGYDSRLVLSAALAGGKKPTTTVFGSEGDLDVQTARYVSQALGCRLEFINEQQAQENPIAADLRRELLYRTNGELPFNAIHKHALIRPSIAASFDLHLIGSGGELFRYFPWKQDLVGIGQRRLANIESTVKYRYKVSPPKMSLFNDNWVPGFHAELARRIEEVCRAEPDALVTQQLDAAYVWKMTSHSTLYISSLYNWLPTVAPLLTAGVVEAAVSVPWKMKLTSQLQRQLIYCNSPLAAHAKTNYGATAEPMSLKNSHLELWQGIKQVADMVNKLERKLLKGAISKKIASVAPPKLQSSAWLTCELREFLSQETMFSREMYRNDGLRSLLAGSDTDWRNDSMTLIKLLNIEILCRELEFTPPHDFLSSG